MHRKSWLIIGLVALVAIGVLILCSEPAVAGKLEDAIAKTLSRHRQRNIDPKAEPGSCVYLVRLVPSGSSGSLGCLGWLDIFNRGSLRWHHGGCSHITVFGLADYGDRSKTRVRC